jgi:hypothetical protein
MGRNQAHNFSEDLAAIAQEDINPSTIWLQVYDNPFHLKN